MNNEILHINNYEMEDISLAMRGSSVNSDTVGTTGKKTFSNITEKGLFEDGMKVITQRFKNLSSKLNNAQNSILNNCDSMFNLEAKLKQEALNIIIPKDFTVNDTITENTFNSRTYSKIDGQSVNAGSQTTNTVNTEINSTINAINLGNINNNVLVQGGQTINEYTNNTANLRNISKSNTLQTQDLKFNVQNSQPTLSNINSGNSVQTAAIDVSSIIANNNN